MASDGPAATPGATLGRDVSPARRKYTRTNNALWNPALIRIAECMIRETVESAFEWVAAAEIDIDERKHGGCGAG